jgi:hypothetical protein
MTTEVMRWAGVAILVSTATVLWWWIVQSIT